MHVLFCVSKLEYYLLVITHVVYYIKLEYIRREIIVANTINDNKSSIHILVRDHGPVISALNL